MKMVVLFVGFGVFGVQGVRIIQFNDDGWVEFYIWILNDVFIEGGYDVVFLVFVENKFGISKCR